MNWNRIGFGTWPLSGDVNGSISYGKTNDRDSRKALLTAFDSGINVYDTSDFYGYGYVEKLLGDVFRDKREKIVLITKGGMISNEGRQNFSLYHIIKSLIKSLYRLRTDYIDVYMLHSPPLSVLKDNKIIGLLEGLQKTGLVKEFGISLISPNDGVNAINHFNFKIIEVNYNILDHRANKNGLFKLCKEKNVKTIIRTPLSQGILSGKFQFTNDKSDKRQVWSVDKVNHLTETYKKMLSALRPNTYTDAQNCLRFCLSNDIINVIIPGMRTEKEVIENIQALTLPILSNNEITNIENIYREML